MSVFILFAVGLVVTAAIAYAVASRLTAESHESAHVDGSSSFAARLASSIGRVPAFAAILLAASAVIFVIMWPLGRLADAVETPFDTHVLNWAQNRHYGSWTSLQKVLTQMGNGLETRVIVVVASVALAIAWRRRGWWIPPLMLVSAFWVERLLQKGLAAAVDRGHPPTTLGTFPSGGCARLILIWGVTLLLVLSTWRFSASVRALLWTLLAMAAFLEGYARTYLLEHWFTDVLGGWLFGSLLLLTFATALSALMSDRDRAQLEEPAAVSGQSTGSTRVG